MNSKKNIRTALVYFFATVISTALILTIFKIFEINLSIPLHFSGDAVQPYNFAQNIEATGWWYSNERLGAPYTQELYDYPLTDSLHFLVIKFLLFVGFGWVQSINIFYILTFPFTTLLSMYAMSKMGIKLKIALAFSLIYAFIPFHLFRGVSHFLIASYYILPIGVLNAFYLAKGTVKSRSFYLVSALLIGASGAYYTYFSLILIATGALIGLSANFSKPLFKKALVLTALIFGVFFLNLIPSFIYSQNYGSNINTTQRNPHESEVFGLKIIQLLLPVEDHNISILNKFAKRYVQYSSPIGLNENQYASLGVTASVGFLILLFYGLFFMRNSPENQNLKILGMFNLVLILVGTVGGLNSIFSYFVNPTFRSLNRISIAIAFLSLCGVAFVLQRLVRRRTVLLLLIVPLALFDQVSAGSMRSFRSYTPYFETLNTFVKEIEANLSPNDMVYTMPFGEYPEGSDKNTMQFALLGEKLKWSTGAAQWRFSSMWQYEVSLLEPEEQIKEVVSRGFSGILLKSNSSTVELKSALDSLLGESTLSFDRTYYFYSLKDYIQENDLSIDETPVDYYVAGNCVKNYNKGTKLFTKQWCVEKAEIVIYNLGEPATKKIVIKIEHAGQEPETMEIVQELPAGLSKIEIEKRSDSIFPKPYNEILWPSTVGFPHFIIYNVEII